MRCFIHQKSKFGRIAMLNERANLIGILYALFVLYATSTALGQSQSANDSLIEKIYQSETRVRDHIDTKTESINTQISDINTKIGTINTNVAVNTTHIGNMQTDIDDLKGTVTWIWRGVIGIFVTLILSVVGYILKSIWQSRTNKDSVETMDPTLQELLKQLLERLDTPRPEEVPSRRSPITFLSEDELRDILKSDDYTKTRKV